MPEQTYLLKSTTKVPLAPLTNAAMTAATESFVEGAATTSTTAVAANTSTGSSTSAVSNTNPVSAATATRNQGGFVRLLAMAGVVMSIALPIGIVPRLKQAEELNSVHQSIEQKVPSVSVQRLTVAPAERKITLPGTIESILETPIYARSNGYVKARFADIGDRVRANQLLAKIEAPEIDNGVEEAEAQVLTTVATKAQSEANEERARADLDRVIAELSQAKANLVERQSDEKFAHSTYLRWKQLGAQGAISTQDVDEKETKYKNSVAAKNAAQDRIKAAMSEVSAAQARLRAESANVKVGAANIAAARARAHRTSAEQNFQNVLSPFSGVITERNVESGTLISSGSDSSKLPLYKLARIDTVKVFVDVPQYAASGIKVGGQVSVLLKELPDRTFKGTIARTSIAFDPSARTMRTEIHIPNSDLKLAPGMYADVAFTLERTYPRILIPSNSLIVRSESPQVILIDASKKAHYQSVTLGEDLGKQIEVVRGLKAGDDIVINPADTLQEGSLVSLSR